MCSALPLEMGPKDTALIAELAADINADAEDFPDRGKFQARRAHRLLNFTKRRVPGVQIGTDSDAQPSGTTVAMEMEEDNKSLQPTSSSSHRSSCDAAELQSCSSRPSLGSPCAEARRSTEACSAITGCATWWRLGRCALLVLLRRKAERLFRRSARLQARHRQPALCAWSGRRSPRQQSGRGSASRPAESLPNKACRDRCSRVT